MTSNNLVSEDCNNKHRSAAFQQSQLDELKRQMDLLASAIRWEDPSSYMHLANNAAGIVRSIDPLSIFAYTDIIRVFKGIIEVVDEQKGSQSSIARWKNCMTCLTTIFPADHLMLSDVFFVLSSLFANGDRLEEALELCGRGLLVRVKLLGPHEKTAESHFHLGLLYFRQEIFQEALKELIQARCIYKKIAASPSISVSDCDMAIGQVEFQLHNLHKSYLSFYQSYRIRLLALGPTHSYTQAALQMVETIRNSGGDLFYCGYELKDRVRTLGWSTYPPQSLKFAVALFVNRSQNDTIFSMQQVRSMVASAFLYCKSRLGISESALEAASEEEVLSQLLSAAPSVEVSTSLPISPPCSPGKMSTSPKPKQIRTAHAPIPTEETKKNGASATTKTPPRVFFQPVSKSVLTQAAISAPQISANPPASPVSPKVTWRPIPPGSPLRPQHLRPLSPSQCSAPSISMRNTYTLLRDEREDRLLVVQRSTPRLLRDCLGSKLAAFGLIAWLSETEDTSAGLENDLNRRRKSSIHRPISVRINEARRRSTMKLQQNSASAGTASAAGAKEALGAMLAMRLGPPMGAPPSSSSSKTTTAAAAPATEKKIIPMPPPVPTSWPPIPFSLSGPAEHPDAPKSIAGLLLGSVDGDIGPKPTKPKLKQVQLAALPSLEGTFWIEPQETLIPASELFDDLEEQFTAGVKKKKSIVMHMNSAPKKEVKALAGKPGASESILDPQRAQNISIMLAKFGKRSFESIAQAIMQFDAESLGQSALSALQQFVPTADEVKKVSAFVDGKVKQRTEGEGMDAKALTQMGVGKAEQFIYAMSKVSQMERRLSAMSSVLNSTEVFPSLISQSDALLNAIAEVKGSGKLKFLLRTYLDLNNALAVQAGLSPSTGFQLSSWRKLSQTKTNNGETMEQYVIGKLAATVPEALELGGDFPSLDEGRQVILSRLQMEVRKLNEGVALLNDLLAAESPDSPSAQNLQKHIEQLSQLLTKAKHHVDMAQTEFSDLLTYFGYVHSSGGNAEPEAFFVEIKDLCRNVSEALARNQTKARRKAIRS